MLLYNMVLFLFKYLDFTRNLGEIVILEKVNLVIKVCLQN